MNTMFNFSKTIFNFSLSWFTQWVWSYIHMDLHLEFISRRGAQISNLIICNIIIFIMETSCPYLITFPYSIGSRCISFPHLRTITWDTQKLNLLFLIQKSILFYRFNTPNCLSNLPIRNDKFCNIFVWISMLTNKLLGFSTLFSNETQ